MSAPQSPIESKTKGDTRLGPRQLTLLVVCQRRAIERPSQYALFCFVNITRNIKKFGVKGASRGAQVASWPNFRQEF